MTTTISVTVNGEQRRFPANLTLAGLAEALGLKLEGVRQAAGARGESIEVWARVGA